MAILLVLVLFGVGVTGWAMWCSPGWGEES